MLEVKGDFCYDVQEMLRQYGRMDDYMELSLPPEPDDEDYGKREVWQWNPLYCPWLDTYSLAYSLASIVNQLFGESKEPFWQQAYTNVIRWILATYRSLPGGWVTFEDVYNCMLNRDELAALIDRHAEHVYGQYEYEVIVPLDDFEKHRDRLTCVKVTEQDVLDYRPLEGTPVVLSEDEKERRALLGGPARRRPGRGAGEARLAARAVRARAGGRREAAGAHAPVRVGDLSEPCGRPSRLRRLPRAVLAVAQAGAGHLLPGHPRSGPSEDDVKLHEKIKQWYADDWLGLDEKLRSSIVEGMAVFLGIFVEPRVAKVFCPKNPERMTEAEKKRMIPRCSRRSRAGRCWP